MSSSATFGAATLTSSSAVETQTAASVQRWRGVTRDPSAAPSVRAIQGLTKRPSGSRRSRSAAKSRQRG